MTTDRSNLIRIAIVSLVASVVLVWVSVATHRADARERAIDGLKQHAALMAASAHLLPVDTMQAYAIRTSTTLGARVTLVAPDGAVVADSAIDLASIPTMENHADRPEIRAAMLRGSGASLRRSSTTQVQYWYVAQRVDTPARVEFVRLAIPTSFLPTPPWTTGWPVLATAILAMLLLIVQSIRSSRQVAHTLNNLSASMEAASPGSTEVDPEIPQSPVARLTAAVRRTEVATQDQVGELNERETVLTSIVSGMKEGLLVVGPDRRIRMSNRAMRDIIGVSFDPAGRLVAEVVRHPTVMRDLETALSDRREIRESIVTFETSGRSFELQITPLPGGEDEGLRLLVLFFDVTRLQALDAVRREFVGNVSHELRTPLTSINAFVETLLEGDLEDPVAVRRFLSIVRKHANRMSALIEDLTDLSAIETGAITMQLDELDARSVVHDVIEQLRPFAEARDVEVTTTLPAPLPVRADRRRMEQVFTNLIHNAIKFNKTPGAVVIDGEQVDDKIQLSIQDTGAGVPSSSHDKIFNRFYQLDKARSREHGGTGLGLAIVKHLMRLHGGSVRVESELGEGSTFFLLLPARSDEEPSTNIKTGS